jgi:HD-GYP domain-containing protein (c-di-GMP phosphodiesterase class II)
MVSEISRLLALRTGYASNEAEVISQAALFHDIGKGDIPPGILTKSGPLTDAEYAVVKTHTQAGCRQIADALRILSAASVVANQHHERLDGSGYLGLAAGQIDPYAKLVAVADVFDALVSRRSYKRPWSQQEVCGYLRDRAGTQFDGEIVAVLLACIDEIVALYV